jgi:hypothetical protein
VEVTVDEIHVRDSISTSGRGERAWSWQWRVDGHDVISTFTT